MSESRRCCTPRFCLVRVVPGDPLCPNRVSFPTLAPVFNLGPGEVIVILVAGLVVLGPEKLPDMLRKAGRLYGELRRMANGFQSELRDAFDEPMKEMRDTVNSTKKMMEGEFGESKPFESTVMSDAERARLVGAVGPASDPGPNFGSAAPASVSPDTTTDPPSTDEWAAERPRFGSAEPALPSLEELADRVPDPIDPSAPPMVAPVGEAPVVYVTPPSPAPPPATPVFLPPPPASAAGWAAPSSPPAPSPWDTP